MSWPGMGLNSRCGIGHSLNGLLIKLWGRGAGEEVTGDMRHSRIIVVSGDQFVCNMIVLGDCHGACYAGTT